MDQWIDQPARQRIETDFIPNILVEASAGSGKTHSLVTRLVNGLECGHYKASNLAVVTFTVKAASELRLRLRSKMGHSGILKNCDEIFIGTIHSFCAEMIRQFPLEAGIAPGFEEIDDARDAQIQSLALNQLLLQPVGRSLLRLVTELGGGRTELRAAFARLCQYSELEYPVEPQTRPNLDQAWREIDIFCERLAPLIPNQPLEVKCTLLSQCRRLLQRAKEWDRDKVGLLWGLLTHIDRTEKGTPKWWPDGRAQMTQVQNLLQEFQAEVAQPHLHDWRCYLYSRMIPVLQEARERCKQLRKSLGLMSFHDLLLGATRLVREHSNARRALAQRFRHILVDEFQDTDPLQAELLFHLASQPTSPDMVDWREIQLRPGALFLVGDPKQSIYRFRRADIQTYQFVKEKIEQQGGSLLCLVTSFRTSDRLCQVLNAALQTLLPPQATPTQAAFAPLKAANPDSQPEDSESPIYQLSITSSRTEQVAKSEAQLVAQLLAQEAEAFQDILILTPRRKQVLHYYRALTQAGIPCQAALEEMPLEEDSIALLQLLVAILDPNDRASRIGALRGPVLGHSDEELYLYFSSGWNKSSDLDSTVDPVSRSLQWLEELKIKISKLGAGAAVEIVARESGLYSKAPEQMANLVAHFSRQLDSGQSLLSDIQELLETESISVNVIAQPFIHGQPTRIRIMNVHKAKGLEADWVLLAAPTDGLPVRVDHVVQQERAYTILASDQVVLAHPPNWQMLQTQEQEYLQAEIDRLIYVAATRARRRLTIGHWQTDSSAGLRTWQKLLDRCSHVTNHVFKECSPPVDITKERLPLQSGHLDRRQSQALEALAAPSWRRITATGLNHGCSTSTLNLDGPGGAAWGHLIHQLLEHAVRDPDMERTQLEALARWFVWQEPTLADYVEEAISQVEQIRQTEFWRRVISSQQRLVEVPFGHRQGQDYLFGVIDLALEHNHSWDIVDYKTDKKSIPQLVEAYAAQVRQYANSWEDISQGDLPVTSASIFSIRQLQLTGDLRQEDSGISGSEPHQSD